MSDKLGSKALKTYNRAFLEALKKLNPAQQEAVSSIEGPVLVVAGPGTGKTHILTARIGRILLETDALAHNILCLTFTDAGVNAMRERLLELIGPEAHRVHIYTFHSFCNSVIKDNLELFGRHDLEPLSDLERVEMIRSILDDIAESNPLKQGRRDIYFFESQLYELFKQIKSEGWTVEHVHSNINTYLENLADDPSFVYQRNTPSAKKGDLKEWKIKEATEKMDRLRAAVDLYPKYVDLMDEKRRYDFDDMILWVLDAFEKHESLLRTYQEQYLYFLVDEYQDTNGAQNQIIQQLIAYWKNPNIFIVGDDDQSIFEFQGARLKNLVDFYQQYQAELKLVLLQDNYRSSQHILDLSKILIDHNTKRIVNELGDIDKTLSAKNETVATLNVKPTICVYSNRLQEEADIVHQIEKLYQAKIPLDEIAVIYAKHKQIKNIISLLDKKGIPYNTKKRVNILDLPLIQNVRSILEYIYTEYRRPHSGELLLFKIMHFNFIGINLLDLTKLSVYLAKFENKIPWREAIADENLLLELGLKNPAKVLQFAALLNELIAAYSNYTLPVLIERVINRSGLLTFILTDVEKVWKLQVIKTFFDFIEKETDKNPRQQLKRLLDTLTNMDANKLALGINKSVYAEDGVNLLTAHSSKGLEFEYVFMLNCIKDNWEPASNSSRFRFPLPTTLTLSGEEDALEARRRLFYVSMTRAKKELYLSYAIKDDAKKKTQRAVFVDEILEASEKSVVIEKELTTDQLIDIHALLLLETKQPVIPANDKAVVSELLKNFSVSVSSLNRFLQCPLSFYYEYVLRVPTTSSEAASYGTAMHYALKRLFDKMLLDESKVFPSEHDFLLFFDNEMKRQRGNFSKKEYDRRLQMGHINLPKYYQSYINDWQKNVQIEHAIRNVEMNGVPLNGTIDKVEVLGEGKVHIVDYKTGSTRDAKLKPPTDKKPLGGLYWRQLIFYKILYAEYRGNKGEASSGEIAYLEPDTQGNFLNKRIEIDIKGTELVKQMIVDSYQKIMRHEFYEGCGESTCIWCNFVRNTNQVDSFIDKDAEDLDD